MIEEENDLTNLLCARVYVFVCAYVYGFVCVWLIKLRASVLFDTTTSEG